MAMQTARGTNSALQEAVVVFIQQVFRKLKALTGKSTTHLIRSIRLAKAKELLETTNLPVSEVGYETGFGNPTYFSRMFQEEFGMPPSSIRRWGNANAPE